MTLSSRSRWAVALAMAVAFLTAAPAITRASDVTIDTGTAYQTIEGFGTCLAWWVNDPNGSVYYDPTFRNLYAKDLGFSILRVEMHPSALMGPGGTLDSRVDLADDVNANVSHFDMARREVAVFGDLAAYLRDNVLEPGTAKVVGAFWTPPHWLKGPTGTSYWTGAAAPWAQDTGNTAGGRLLQDEASKTQFARYAAAWIRAFEQRFGVTFTGVSLQNELIFETAYNSCTYWKSPSAQVDQFWQYADALRAVGDYFKAKGMTVKIMGPHHSHIAGSPGNPWHLGIQMGFVDAVKNHASGNLMNSLGIFASNDYVDEGLNNHAVMLRAYWEGRSRTPASWTSWGHEGNISQYGKPNWFQEGSGEGTTWDKDNALGLAQKLHDALVEGHASAYIYWQTADGAADPNGNILLGTNQLANPTASKKYCSMKHFSRYIRPGSRRIKATFDQSGAASYGGSGADDTYNSLNVSAYVKGGDLTVVLVNMRSAADTTNLKIPSGLGISSMQQWRTTGSESFAAQPNLSVSNNQVSVSVPALSVVTLYGRGSGSGGNTGTLTVSKSGTGSGMVTSSPAGINCGTTCSASYTSGTSITLTASPASGSTFAGWAGGCSGTGTCTVAVNSNASVTASFNGSGGGSTYALSVTKSGTGSGTVTSSPAGISCGTTCSGSFASGAAVALTAAPASGSTFGGWGGACSGTGACAVTMSAAQSVTAAFNRGSAGGGGTYGNNGNPWAIGSGTTRIQAENYDTGGEGVGYHDSDAANSGGAYRADGVDLESASGGGYDVGYVVAGEWLDYTVNVATAGNYDLKLHVARQPSGNTTVKVLFGGADKTGDLSVPSTGGWQSWTDVTKTGVSLSAGSQVMQIAMSGSSFNVDWIEITPSSSTPPPSGGGATYGNNGNPWAIGSGATRIEAENYDTGGEGVGHHDSDAANSGGQYRTDGVDIESASGGGYDVGWTTAGEWLNYTVNVATAGNYDLKLHVARQPSGNSTIKALFGGADKTGDLSVPSTGGWQSWTDVTKTGVSLSAGKQVMQIAITGSLYNVDWIEITPSSTTPPPPPSGGGATYGNNGNPWAIGSATTRIQAENYDTGGEGVGYHDTTPGNAGGQYRFEDVDIESTSGGGYDVGYIAGGEWLDYTANVATAGNYDVTMRVAREAAGNSTLQVLSNGVDKTGLWALPSTGAWQTWTTVTKTISLGAGTQTLRLAVNGGEFNVDWLEIKPSGSTPGGSAQTIYADALAPGWSSSSWSATVDFNGSSPVQAGTRAVNVTLQSWGALALSNTTALSTTGLSAVRFWVYGGTGSTKSLRAFTYSGDTTGQSTAATIAAVANAWTQITVPLTALGSPSTIKRLAIQENNGVNEPMITIDEIALIP